MEARGPEAKFGELLRAFRLVAGLSQEVLAERAHISVKTVGAIEQGLRRAPYRHTVGTLADALQLSAREREELESAAQRARTRESRRSSPSAAPAPSSYLPKSLTPFVARPEVDEIGAMIRQHRLVTITGSGGVGKTRTAIEIASRHENRTGQSVVFADLSSVQDGAFVIDALALALDAPLSDEDRSSQAIVRALGWRKILLIIDNCEHLVATVAGLVATLLKECPNLSVLTTSRELIDLSSEVVYRLPSLQIPEKRVTTMAEARSFSAISLFLQRAHLADPRLSLSLEHMPDVVDICRRLNGIPLAIELAAARISSIGLRTLCLRISQTLSLEGNRDLPARQKTMEATISWSFALLSDEERLLLVRLSVFAGAFTIDAVEHACTDKSLPVQRVTSLLSRLVDKSLVNSVTFRTQTRYTLLDTIRAFSRARLKERGESEIAFRRHAEWLGEVGDFLSTNPFGVGYDRPDDLENARAATEWCMASGSQADVVLAARIVGGMRRVWDTCGNRRELHQHVMNVLEKLTDCEENYALFARLWRARAIVTNPLSRDFVEQAAQLFVRFGDLDAYAGIYGKLALAYARLGQFELANETLAPAVRHFNATERECDKQAYLEYALSRIWILLAQGEVERSRTALQDLRTVFKNAGIDPDAHGDVLNISGQVEFVSGNAILAVELDYKALEIMYNYKAHSRATVSACGDLACHLLAVDDAIAAERVGRHGLNGVLLHGRDLEKPESIVQYVAAAVATRGRLETAGIMLGFLEAYRQGIGNVRLSQMDVPSYEMLLAALHERLPDSEFQRLRGEGALLDLPDAAERLLSESDDTVAEWPIERLIAENRRLRGWAPSSVVPSGSYGA